MVKEDLIDTRSAVRAVTRQVDQLLHPTIDAKSARADRDRLAAIAGRGSGKIVFMSNGGGPGERRRGRGACARRNLARGHSTACVARAILTSTGGMRSHAALVARGMGKCCVVDARDVEVDYASADARAREILPELTEITVEGSTGNVYPGRHSHRAGRARHDLRAVHAVGGRGAPAARARQRRHAGGRAHVARKFGAEGIGLCRTEHMFFP
jgi:pyruvate,orthophosphate dikinase